MALQTDKRLGRCRKISNFQEGRGVATSLLRRLLDSQATRSVARLTVDQRQSGGSVHLLPMHRHVKIPQDFIVFVTFGEATFIADVIGIEAADYKAFVLAYWKYRLVGTQARRIGASDQNGQTE